MTDQRKNEIYDQWFYCWESKNFPKEMVPASYSAWRKFLDYWFKHPDWTLMEAFNEYTKVLL